MKIKPIGDRIIIDVTITDKTQGGIILVGKSRIKEQMAKVVAVGPGLPNSKGDLIPGEIKVGDMVLFPQFVGNKLSNWNHRALAAEWGTDIPDNLWIMKESEVLAVVE